LGYFSPLKLAENSPIKEMLHPSEVVEIGKIIPKKI
jgi:hypothetical protein